MDINITKCTSTANTTACKRTPKYIVIHYTAGTSSKSGSAKSNALYFSKPSAKASADFFVDDTTIVQFNPDPTKYYCWSVGGSKYTSMTTSEGGKYYNIAKNSNCVNIEMCSNKHDKTTLNATDMDWYLTDETLNHAAELTRYLMDLYSIPISHVIMHHHVTGKICPNPFCVNETALSKWYAFKDMVNSSGKTPSDVQTGTATNQLYRVRKTWTDYASQLGAFTSLENAKNACRDGYSVFDNNGNIIFSNNCENTSQNTSATYTHTDFVKEVQRTIGAKIDGIAGPETLSKTITVSMYKNNRHAVVKPIQMYLNSIGYSCDTADGIAGVKFETAIKSFQKANGCIADGEITKGKNTWAKLLNL